MSIGEVGQEGTMAFVVFEGLDGAGKSTLISGIQNRLETKGHGVYLTREPGGTPVGEEIRQMLLRTKGEAPVPRAELLLYQAARAQHVDSVIRPQLTKGAWVLCDRFFASTIAFQAGGRSLKRADIDWLNAFSTNDLKPDLWVLLDLSVEEASKRMVDRELDRFENEAKDFHQRVRRAYLDLAKAEEQNWLVMDAAKSANELANQLWTHLEGKQWV